MTDASSSADVNAVPLWRRGISGMLGLVAAATLLSSAPQEAYGILALPVTLLGISSLTIHVKGFGPQLLSRAIWWSNLALGTVLCVIGSASERRGGIGLALACGAALLVASPRGLAAGRAGAGYTPAAFQGSLLLLMIFALADAQTFLLFGIIALDRDNGLTNAPVSLATGAAYVIGFAGLYRLKAWGAIVNVGTSTIVFGLSLAGLLSTDHSLKVFFAVVSAAHVLAAAPMLVALATGRSLPSLSPRRRELAAKLAISGLMLLSAGYWLSPSR